MSSPARLRQVRNNKRRYSELEHANTNALAPNPTMVKYRAVAVNKVFDWELEFMTVKHHYALKKELTTDITLPPLKIHMQLSFNFDGEDGDGNHNEHSNSSPNSTNDSSNPGSADSKDDCDIRLWLVIDHQNEQINKSKRSTFDFGVKYLRRRLPPHHSSSGGCPSSGSASPSHPSSSVGIRSLYHQSLNWNELNAKQSHCAAGSMWGFQIGKNLNDLKKYCLPKESKMLFRFDVDFVSKCESQVGPIPQDAAGMGSEAAKSPFVGRMERMWKEGLFTDITIECPAHLPDGQCSLCQDFNEMKLAESGLEADRVALCGASAGGGGHRATKSKRNGAPSKHCKSTKQRAKRSEPTDDALAESDRERDRAEKPSVFGQRPQRASHCKNKPRINGKAQNWDSDDDDDRDSDTEGVRRRKGSEREDGGGGGGGGGGADEEEEDGDEANEEEGDEEEGDEKEGDDDGEGAAGGGGGGRGDDEEGDRNHNNSAAPSSTGKQKRRRNKENVDHNVGGDGLQCLDQLSDGEGIGAADRFSIRAHKSVLSSVSSVFLAMLSSHLKEREQSLIVIDDLCFQTVHHLLHYAYTDRVDPSCDLKALFAAAEKYQIYDLCHICLERMQSLIDMDSVCELMVFLERYRDNHHIDEMMMKKLEGQLLEFMVEHYPQISKMNSYRKLKSKIESKLTMFMYQKQFGSRK